MSSRATGTICHIGETKEYGQNGFRKRQLVLAQEDGKYDNYIPIEFIQDMCDDVEGLKLGSEVTVEYKLSGRKWRSPEGDVRYFLNLEAVDVIDTDSENAAEASHNDDQDDEVPF